MTSVLTALPARWDGPVVSALESAGQVRIARRCADLADLLAAAASGLGRVALVSSELRGLTLSVVSGLRESGVEVIGVGESGDDLGEARLWQLGVHSVISPDLESDALVAAVLTAATAGGPQRPTSPASEDDVAPYAAAPTPLAAQPPLPVRETRGQVVAVWGPAGSPGRTLLAVNLAAELAALGREVLLVDADTYGGSVAQALSVLDEAPGIAAATRAGDQGTLDLAVLARLAPEVCPGLRVLTGIPRAERWPEIRGAALERVLAVARHLADDVIVDVGFCLEDDEELSYDTQAPRRNQATLTTLEVADGLVVVGGCDPVSLQRLVRGLQEIGRVRAPHPIVVVNRLRASAVGSPPARRVTDALARFAGVTDLHLVPDDPSAVDAAMLAGRTLIEAVPASPARRAIADLARRLADSAPTAGEPVAESGAGEASMRPVARSSPPVPPDTAPRAWLRGRHTGWWQRRSRT
ncbi:MAG: hypothetical protein IPL45_04585 [Actinomycetales bacterium]|nr:hypothetical protein [Actinomycetales bacterium]